MRAIRRLAICLSVFSGKLLAPKQTLPDELRQCRADENLRQLLRDDEDFVRQYAGGNLRRLESADASVGLDAVGRDTRIGKKYLKSAVGYGGPCFPRDTIAFARMAELVHSRADLALATDAINRRQVLRLMNIIESVTPARGIIRSLAFPISLTQPWSRSPRVSYWEKH